MFKAAVIGLGQIGLTYDLDPKRKNTSSHILAYLNSPNIDLVAACDIDDSKINLLCNFIKGVNFYNRFSDLLEYENLDIVSICTPAYDHLNQIKEALASVKPPKIVLCEKPIVKNRDEAKELIAFLENNNKNTVIIPNLSRRWLTGFQEVATSIDKQEFGCIQKIHLRYTRGIYNTGAHLFDLVNWFAGKIEDVLVLHKVSTSSEEGGDPSFTFHFKTKKGVFGIADAFDDNQYYMFEIDLYFEKGKIEIYDSGDSMKYYTIREHNLFSGFRKLYKINERFNVLSESSIQNTVTQIEKILKDTEKPIVTAEDGIYPILVAEALIRSFNTKATEKVIYSW